MAYGSRELLNSMWQQEDTQHKVVCIRKCVCVYSCVLWCLVGLTVFLAIMGECVYVCVCLGAIDMLSFNVGVNLSNENCLDAITIFACPQFLPLEITYFECSVCGGG